MTEEKVIFHNSDEVLQPSERAFGLTFTVIFLLFALSPLLYQGKWHAIHNLGLACSAVFLLLTFAFPIWLRLPNFLWFKFGMFLHMIVQPVVMAVIFYGVITPYALCFRGLIKKTFPREFAPELASYWIPREPWNPKQMRQQF